jgi:hypothetical protein
MWKSLLNYVRNREWTETFRRFIIGKQSSIGCISFAIQPGIWYREHIYDFTREAHAARSFLSELAAFYFFKEADLVFEKKYEEFWKEQVRGADGQRLEMLKRDLTGTKKLLEILLLPIFGSFEGLVLEYEMVSLSGVKIYGDVFHPMLRTVFEEDNFVTHAEKITRDRFSFERARARSIPTLGYTYFPYSRDELEKKPDFCQRNLYELIGRIGNADGVGLYQLPVYEREVMRSALLRNKPFRLADVCVWLLLKKETCRKVLRDLETKGLVYSIGGGKTRCHEFMITE